MVNIPTSSNSTKTKIGLSVGTLVLAGIISGCSHNAQNVLDGTGNQSKPSSQLPTNKATETKKSSGFIKTLKDNCQGYYNEKKTAGSAACKYGYSDKRSIDPDGTKSRNQKTKQIVINTDGQGVDQNTGEFPLITSETIAINPFVGSQVIQDGQPNGQTIQEETQFRGPGGFYTRQQGGRNGNKENTGVVFAGGYNQVLRDKDGSILKSHGVSGQTVLGTDNTGKITYSQRTQSQVINPNADTESSRKDKIKTGE